MSNTRLKQVRRFWCRYGKRADLAQAHVLGLGPYGHLAGSGGDEDERGQRPGGGREQDPAIDLKGVIGAGDVVEAEAAWNRVALPAWRPQVALNHVCPAAPVPRHSVRGCVTRPRMLVS